MSSRPQGMTEPQPARAVLGLSNLRLAWQDLRVFGAATPLRVVQVALPLVVCAVADWLIAGAAEHGVAVQA